MDGEVQSVVKAWSQFGIVMGLQLSDDGHKTRGMRVVLRPHPGTKFTVLMHHLSVTVRGLRSEGHRSEMHLMEHIVMGDKLIMVSVADGPDTNWKNNYVHSPWDFDQHIDGWVDDDGNLYDKPLVDPDMMGGDEEGAGLSDKLN